MNPNDIAGHHRSRLALIYVRQSSPLQVLHHRESQHRQRSFQQRAADLGWPAERITVIDEDLGQSATKRYRVQSSMSEDGLQVPIVSGPRQRLRWRRPDYAHLRRILTHPIYAGAYCYGRLQVEQFLDADQRPAKKMRDQPRQQWHVLIRDHHEAYVSWERFERIQRQIESELARPRRATRRTCSVAGADPVRSVRPA